jgi:FMN phosphatase YigB (HAD superfamily)
LTLVLGNKFTSLLMDKKIIVDCDGVLLDWAYAFDIWMLEQGYCKVPNTQKYYNQSIRYGITEKESFRQVKKFNESGCVGFIPAFKDSVEYVTKLSKDGWNFEVISCLDKDKYAQKLRNNNLIHLFGDIFDFIDCGLDYTVGKEQYLLDRYKEKNYYWIEDSVNHAESGKKVGLKSIIMDHPYNQEWKGMRVKNWKELYTLILNDTSH